MQGQIPGLLHRRERCETLLHWKRESQGIKKSILSLTEWGKATLGYSFTVSPFHNVSWVYWLEVQIQLVCKVFVIINSNN